MGRGMRIGALSKVDLEKRILDRFPGVKIPKNAPTSQLLGHAIYHDLVTEKEIDETTPRNQISTIPCYLYTYVSDPAIRSQLEKYVVAASKLYCRGSIILNLIAMYHCGLRHPGASDSGKVTVSVLRPQFRSDDLTDPIMNGMRRLVSLLEAPEGKDITSNTLKHAFLPERWTVQKRNERSAMQDSNVQRTLQSDSCKDVLPPCPSDWRQVMKVTGWDNCINRMMTKYCGNIKVHAMSNIVRSVEEYLWAAPTEAPYTTMMDLVFKPNRLFPAPVEGVSDSDYAFAMDLRKSLLGSDTCMKPFIANAGPFQGQEITTFTHWHIVKDNIKYSSSLLLLHLFLVRYGVYDRSYLPVATRGRKYAYVDTKIAHFLFPNDASIDKPSVASSSSPINQDDEDENDTEDSSVSVGEVLGITPTQFNSTRSKIRSHVRRQKRRSVNRRLTDRERKKAIKERERWKRIGRSRMPLGARIDSIETDGVGLRIVVKLKDDIRHYIVPIGSTPIRLNKNIERKRVKSTKRKEEQETAHLLSQGAEPIFLTNDPGGAKPYAAAISQDQNQLPKMMAFHKRRYYHEMGNKARAQWEKNVVAGNSRLKEAIELLSLSGGTSNCDADKWFSYLRNEHAYRDLLDEEYINKVDRAKWTMRMFRNKAKSIDNAVNRLFKSALTQDGKLIPIDRPLVIGFGSADFNNCGMKGHMAAPSAKLERAMNREIDRIRKTGRQVVIYGVDEFRTTMCCCACGAVTTPPKVKQKKRNKQTNEIEVTIDSSRRLRQCTQCLPDGKLRDRDSQAARNILKATIALFYGKPRPEYLCRPKKDVELQGEDA